MKKVMLILVLLLTVATIASLWLSPAISPVLGILSLLISLALSTYAIVHKHKGTENARAKILKEVGVMVFTLIAVIFLGGTAAMLANAQVNVRWGEVAGLLSAIGASFLVGYSVRKGLLRLVG
jgi:EamA domain-containing membrane protein RarD